MSPNGMEIEVDFSETVGHKVIQIILAFSK